MKLVHFIRRDVHEFFSQSYSNHRLDSNTMTAIRSPRIWVGFVDLSDWNSSEVTLVLNDALKSLSLEDVQRLERKKRDLARQEFLVGRWLTSVVKGCMVSDLKTRDTRLKKAEFQVDGMGRPGFVMGDDVSEIKVSITHSSGVIAVAMCFELAVGIDLQSAKLSSADLHDDLGKDSDEPFRENANLKPFLVRNSFLKRRERALDAYPLVLNQDELAILGNIVTPAESHFDFIRRWTIKEAIVKATGAVGLARVAAVDTSRTISFPEERTLETVIPVEVRTMRDLFVPLEELRFDDSAFSIAMIQPRPKIILSVAIEQGETAIGQTTHWRLVS